MTSCVEPRPAADGYIVAYDGSSEQTAALRVIVADALQATSPPTAAAIQARLRWPASRTWLAAVQPGGQLAGFLSTFHTDSRAGRRIEFDLLAVHPAVQRQGLAGLLMREALAHWRAAGAVSGRALVRQGNLASERVFLRAGFEPLGWQGRLMLCTLPGKADRRTSGAVVVRSATGADIPQLARRWPACESLPAGDDSGLIVAHRGGAPCGFVELLAVHTVTYSGAWLESLLAVDDDESVIAALIDAAADWALRRSLDVAGAVVDLTRRPVHRQLARSGYRSAGIYRYVVSTISGARAPAAGGERAIPD